MLFQLPNSGCCFVFHQSSKKKNSAAFELSELFITLLLPGSLYVGLRKHYQTLPLVDESHVTHTKELTSVDKTYMAVAIEANNRK